jgi:NADH-quinone oxidoreductase subunit L
VYLLDHAYLIALFPLAASALILLFGRHEKMLGPVLGIPAVLYGLVHSVLLLFGLLSGRVVLPHEHGPSGAFFQQAIEWFSTGFFRFELGVMIDGMSAMLLVVVTLVSTLVQTYSLGYMHDAPRFSRFYGYLNLFTGGMLILTLANNFLQFFIGWEIMGLCSYLLIGFEFEREAAAYAGRKAFLTTRVGDLGMTLGLLLLFTSLNTFNFVQLFERKDELLKMAPWIVTAIPVLLFCGSMGKSAQIPLHVWLPDAMEGPTPVSALIHAATMVAAGVYLVGRFFFVFEMSPVALDVVGWVGGVTALVAALSALVADDIKKVLAYSTISQLGFMFAAMGAGHSPQAGMFHLTTHAFFKALMFLGAGSVIHALHTNDLWKMGGLSKKLPATFLTFAAGWLAIIGTPLFSGFYSKEAILHAVHAQHNAPLFWILAFTAFLTTFYMTRLFILAFLGDSRDKEKFHHAHESGVSMVGPLVLLAVLSVVAGLGFHYQDNWGRLVPAAHAAAEHAGGGEGNFVLYVSLSVWLSGLVLAFATYSFKVIDSDALAKRFPGVYAFLGRRYLDEAYVAAINAVYHPLCRAAAWFDYNVMDQKLVDGFGWAGQKLSRFQSWLDDTFVDGFLVNGFGRLSQGFGAGVRRLQSGFAQFYLLAVAAGVSFLILWAANVFK